MPKRLSDRRGFTLIELSIVISIVAILATVAIPKISNSIRSGNEAGTIAKLNSVRAAINLYYADQEGQYPTDLTPITQPGSKYLPSGVQFWTQNHGNSATVDYRSSVDKTIDTGAWGYANDPAGTGFGTLWIECTHTDLKGSAWADY